MLSLVRASATRAASARTTAAVCTVARRMYGDEGAIRGAGDSFSKKVSWPRGLHARLSRQSVLC